MKFDLPEPFGPISTLIGPSGKFSIWLILLKPLIEILWSVDIVNSYCDLFAWKALTVRTSRPGK